MTPTYWFSNRHRPGKNGNTSDPAWNTPNLKALEKALPLETLRPVTYGAAPRLVTPDNLALLDKARIRLVSRLPDTDGVVDQLKRRAMDDGILEDQKAFVLAHYGVAVVRTTVRKPRGYPEERVVGYGMALLGAITALARPGLEARAP